MRVSPGSIKLRHHHYLVTASRETSSAAEILMKLDQASRSINFENPIELFFFHSNTLLESMMWNGNLNANGLSTTSNSSPTRSGILTEQQASDLKKLGRQMWLSLISRTSLTTWKLGGINYFGQGHFRVISRSFPDTRNALKKSSSMPINRDS